MPRPDARIPLGVVQSNIGTIASQFANDMQEDRLVRADLETAKLQQDKLKEEAQIRQEERRAKAEESTAAKNAVINAYTEVQTIRTLLADGNKEDAMKLVGRTGLDMLESGADVTFIKRFGNLLQKDAVGAGAYLDQQVIPKLEGAYLKAIKEEFKPIDKDAVIHNEEDNSNTYTEIGSGGTIRETPLAPGGNKPVEPQETFTQHTDPVTGLRYQVSSLTGRRVDDPTNPPSSGVTVNTGDNESAANKTFYAEVGKRANERIVMLDNARAQNAQLERVALALANNADTGVGSEIILNMKGIGANFFGMNFEGMAEQEIIRQVSSEMALRLRNPESGMGLTGNTSNRDLTFLKEAVIGLGRSEEGNKMIIDFMMRKNDLTMALARKQAELISANQGNIPDNLDTQLMEYVDQYEFFKPGEREKIDGILNRGPSGSISKPIGDMTEEELEEEERRLKRELGIQ